MSTKCKFKEELNDNSEFKIWIRHVVGDVHQAYCKVCQKSFIGNMGLSAFKSHAKGLVDKASISQSSVL